MWRNVEVRDFVEWLRRHNAELAPGRRAGFYGLDLYSLHTSAGAVLDYLDRTDPEAARVARERYGCLTPWQRDPATYGRAALRAGYALCEDAVSATLRDLLAHRLEYMAEDPESFLDAEQNARLVASAEQYYRVMYYGSAESWNLRDSHMHQTLRSVLDARGPDSKAVVWAHNSHVGDASATDMSTMRGELNLGQLCREQWGDRVSIVGFGTDRGTVAAASDWDSPMEIKSVRPSRPDSYEHLCHRAGIDRFLLDLRSERSVDVQRALAAARLERAIGVIYRPETELASHYFEASLPRQFDAYIWFDETRAVTPLEGVQRPSEDMPETYPFGM
jgi:erythromycin esterase-like protein